MNQTEAATTNGTKTLPNGWRWVKLGEACRVVGGSTPSSHVPQFWGGDIVWITPTDLGLSSAGKLESEFIVTSARQITKAGYENCGTELVPPGSVVLSSRAPIGHLGIADVSLCTNQGCKSFVPSSEIDSRYLFYALKISVPNLQALGSGATFTEVSKTELERFEIPLPPLMEQKRIADVLKTQIEVVERARSATEAQLEAAKVLPAVYLRSIFGRPEVGTWPRRRLSEVAELLPAKSIATAGDTEVRVVTTACLTEAGFDPAGIKTARMWSDDAADCVIGGGEVLIARSNTPGLVGRVAMYSGNHGDVVASDLTIRILPKDMITSAFLSAYLSFLFVSGYWKERAGGASGSMKKITRAQIRCESVPVPPLSGQQAIVDRLSEKIAETANLRTALITQLDTITRLPATLLRQAFNGEL